MSLLAVEGLAKSFGGVAALAEVSFALEAGQMLAMIGPNGAGKTTCFNMLGGQLRPDRGSIRLAGRELAGLKPRQIWRLGVGRSFQVTATFGSMSLRENLQMALISYHRRTFALWPRAAALYRAEAMALLERLGLAEQSERACGLLAYGDLKRVELAMALANAPRLLLMDEPTAGMAPGERKVLMALVGEIMREREMAVLFTEHDMDIVFGHADRVLVLDRGLAIAEGPPDAVRADPRVRAVYLGGAA
jgi:branched-chain amino acid transport system ATP-binding protein